MELVTVMVILLLVLFSAIDNELLQTQDQGTLGQAVDFQGECGDLIKMQVSIIECQSSVRLEQGHRKFFQGEISCFFGTHY